jgi:hypothetical protein
MVCRTKAWFAVVALMLVAGTAWSGESADVVAADFGPPIAPEVLDQHRAGESKQQLNWMDVRANLEDNKAIDTFNGSNFITGDSFSHASGLPVAVQNSGNNVIIQNAFILNLNVK